MSKANPKPGEMPVKGKMLSSQANARIFESFPFNDYEISEPAFSEDEKQLFSALLAFVQRKTTFSRESKAISKQLPAQFFGDLSQTLLRDIDIEGLSRRIPTEQEAASLQAMLEIALSGIEFAKNREGIARNVLDKSIGFGPLSEMMRDPTLEEIMINSEDKVFVFHKDFGMCKANTAFSNREEFLDLISRIANTVGRKFDSYNTFLDARLPDGSRANATYPTITPVSPTLTIRKFSQIPLSIIDLISNRTMNSELAAFLWAMVEGMRIEPMNLIVAGGTGCGKTTTLNALSTFIRANERIITIEDTLELDLGSRENWVQMESRPKTRDEIDVTMDDLLKNSLRMRPDRIIVGEVRGPEAHTMFISMDIGHRGTMGTVHANTARELLIRLQSEPMSVPDSLLPLLDLILIQNKVYSKDRGVVRHVSQLAEVGRMEGKALLGTIFEWKAGRENVERTDVPSRVLDTLSEKAGITKKELMQEIKIRQKVLEWMQKENIHSNPDVEKTIQDYYFKPESVLQKVSDGL